MTCRAGRAGRADRVLGRALGAGGRRRRHRLPRPHQPDRRLQLPRAGAPRRRPLVFLSTSRVYPVGAAGGAGAGRGRRRASSSPPSRRCAGSRRAGIAEDFPLEGARTLYGATKLAAELLIEEYRGGFGLRGGDRPLRGDRRALADGQGRPGRVHPLDARPPLRQPAQLHRLRGAGKQVRDLLHVDDLVELVERPAARSRRLGRPHGERRRRPECSLSLRRDDRDLPRADRQ